MYRKFVFKVRLPKLVRSSAGGRLTAFYDICNHEEYLNNGQDALPSELNINPFRAVLPIIRYYLHFKSY